MPVWTVAAASPQQAYGQMGSRCESPLHSGSFAYKSTLHAPSLELEQLCEQSSGQIIVLMSPDVRYYEVPDLQPLPSRNFPLLHFDSFELSLNLQNLPLSPTFSL